MKRDNAVTVAQIDDFDEIVDVRSPGEFALDRVPGAVNFPVLDDEQRARIGTLYKQVSPFEARRLGAALIARNIAQHLETAFSQRPREWRPLVYCWRGGSRSAAMAHVMRDVGWRVATLEGGYQNYRRDVLVELDTRPRTLSFQVICGPTGSGKSRLLHALSAVGAQVLDLEALACHRGSVLGGFPDAPQPTQKWFDSQLWNTLRRFDPARPVWVEAESRKIGVLHLPEQLLSSMRTAPCWLIEAPVEERVEFLIAGYAHMLDDPGWLKSRLSHLAGLQSREVLQRWDALIDARDWPALVLDLLVNHYDPLYLRSMGKSFAGLAGARTLALERLDAAEMAGVANRLIGEAEPDAVIG